MGMAIGVGWRVRSVAWFVALVALVCMTGFSASIQPDGPVCDGSEPLEGEPVCADEYVDAFNGGLNSDPPVYSPIACGESVCGETGTFVHEGLTTRDTDWYLVTLIEPADVTWSVTADGFAHAITTVDISAPGGAVVGDYVVSTAGETLTVTNCLGPGQWALFVTTFAFTGVPCGSTYSGSVSCQPCGPPGTGACCLGCLPCVDDILTLIGLWGPCIACREDLDLSGSIDFADILAVIASWGPCP
ncbi:MAG: hypothetical protein GY715_03140 [Planctomycetes bacterium]|nr:hypothetical protein [Planctomycetota bacterium]